MTEKSYISATTTARNGDGVSATNEELARAEVILEEFNEAAGTDFTARSYVAKIVSRLREHPDLDTDDHCEIIERTLCVDDPWWTTLTPNVIYGNDGVFEAAANRAHLLGGDGDDDGEDSPF